MQGYGVRAGDSGDMGTLIITKRDVSEMCSHWLGTPPGGYLGSDYGADVKSLIHSPMSGTQADELIAKCRIDVPIIDQLPAGAVNVYAYDKDFDQKALVFEIGGELLDIDGDQFAPQVTPPLQDSIPELLDTVNEGTADRLHEEIHVILPYPGYW